MKKSLIAVLFVCLCLLFVVSCKDEELEVKVNSVVTEQEEIKVELESVKSELESAKVTISELQKTITVLEDSISVLKEEKVSTGFYGTVYKVTDDTWNKIEEFYKENKDLCDENKDSWLENAYSYAYKMYTSGKSAFMAKYGKLRVAFNDDGEMTTINKSGDAITVSSKIVGDEVIGLYSYDYYSSLSETTEHVDNPVFIGSFENNQSSINVSLLPYNTEGDCQDYYSLICLYK